MLVGLPLSLKSLISLQSKGPVVFGFVQRISNTRSLSLEQHRIISRCAQNTSDDRGEERYNKVVVGRRKHLSAIDDSREQSRTKVSSRVNGLVIFISANF